MCTHIFNLMLVLRLLHCYKHLQRLVQEILFTLFSSQMAVIVNGNVPHVNCEVASSLCHIINNLLSVFKIHLGEVTHFHYVVIHLVHSYGTVALVAACVVTLSCRNIKMISAQSKLTAR